MDKPITWQQVVIVLLCIVVLAGLFCVVGARLSDETRLLGWAMLGGAVPLIALMTVWHLKATNVPDLEPDVLAALIGPEGVLQTGDVHYAVNVTNGPTIVVLAQNLRAAAATFDLDLKPKKGGEGLMTPMPPLRVKLSPAGVTVSTLRVPFRPGQETPLKLALDASARSEAGEKVRFGRRSVASKAVNPALTGALLLTGTIYAGGGTFLEIQPPLERSAAFSREGTQWRTQVLWSLEDRATIAQVSTRLQDSINA